MFLFASCSCEKQLQRLRIKCPECFADTTISVPVIISEYETDTVFISSNTIDTFSIVKDRVEVQILKSTDTLKVYVKIPADTIIKAVTVEKIMPCNRKHLDEKTIEKHAKRETAALFAGLFFWGFILMLSLWIKKRLKK